MARCCTMLLLLVGTSVFGQVLPAPDGDVDPGCHLITGRVVARGSNEALAGVEVLIGQRVAATTSGTGEFELCAQTPEPVTAQLRLGGFTTLEVVLRSRPDEQVTIVMDREETATFADELTVIGKEIRSVEPVVEVPQEAVVKMPGAGEDVLQTIRAMPGVVSVDDWSSRLYVRGGRPDQNGIYLDGISIYDPYRLFGLTSLFNPETVDSIAFYPGGFDVLYGDRLSAVIAVENRDGVVDRKIAGSANISLTNTNLVAEGGISERRPSSWMVSARRTYYDLILKATGETDSEFPAFTDAQARLMFQPSPGHRFSVTLLGYDEGTDLVEDDEPTFGDVDDHIEALDDQRGFIAGVQGDHRLSRRARVHWVLSATENQQATDFLFLDGETSFETSYDQVLTGEVLALRTVLDFYLADHTLQAGVEASHSTNEVDFRFNTDDPRILIPDTLLNFGEAQDFRKLALFAQDTWQLQPALAFKAGVRWDQSTLSDLSTISPRLSVRWEPTPRWELRAAWGHYTQFASYESLQGDGYFLDLRGIKELRLEPERAVHWLLSGSHTSSSGWRLSVDLYHKDLDDILQSGEINEEILVLDDNDVAQPYTRDRLNFIPENARSGYARGAELSFTVLEHADRPYYGMFTYTFGQAETEDEEGPLAERWDQRHSANIFGGWRFGRHWDVGVRWRFATGFPFTPLSNVIRVVEDVDDDGIYDPEAGDWYTYQRDEPHEVLRSERLPVYHRLDLRVQYARLFGRVHMTFYLDVINAYARENAVGYEYNEDFSEREVVAGMPIIPSLGAKFVF